MSRTETIKRKIDGIHDMQSVVKTMKSLAAVKIHFYERAVESLRQYYETVEKGIQAALAGSPGIPQVKELYGGETCGAIVFSSEQGMCGQFNDALESYIEEDIAREDKKYKDIAVLSVGEKLTYKLADKGFNIDRQISLSSSLGDIIPIAEEIVITMEEWQRGKNIDNIFLYYNSPSKGAGFNPVKKKAFPVDAEMINEIRSREWSSRCRPLFRITAEELLSSLLRDLIFTVVLRACTESLSAENAARLSAMQSAEKNIDEKLDELSSEYHRERQSEITGELLDIVSGFEVLTEKAR